MCVLSFVVCFLVLEMLLRFFCRHTPPPLVLVLFASLATTPCNRSVLVPIMERLHWSMAIICNLDCLREYLRREQAAATVTAEAEAKTQDPGKALSLLRLADAVASEEITNGATAQLLSGIPPRRGLHRNQHPPCLGLN